MVEELKVLQDVVSKLQDAKISYMITGSMAMMYYAIPRLTRDIDFVVELHIQDIPNLVSLFEKEYYVDADMIQDAIKEERMFNLIHNESSFKIDCIIRKKNEYEDLKFSRRKLLELDGFHAYVISPEDLILSKLTWAKESESEMQLTDIKIILFSSNQLDETYIDAWSEKLNVKQLLSKCRQMKN